MEKSEPLSSYRLTSHARSEMARRQITEREVDKVLSAPEQAESVREGRIIFQSRLEWSQPPKLYLLRVIVDVDREPPEVITVYRTSKIEKYWRSQK